MCTPKKEFDRFKESGAFTNEPPARETGSEQDRLQAKSISRYVSHETGIDRLIADAHGLWYRTGKVGVMPSNNIGIDYNKTVNHILDVTKTTVNISEGLIPIQDRPCYIIPITEYIAAQLKNCGVELESTTEENRTVIPYYHSSNNAVHIFLSEEDINAIDAVREGARDADSDEAGRVLKYIEASIAHEVGVMLGMQIIKFKDNAPYNEMDQRYQDALSGAVLEPKQFAIANLDQNLDMRDYAAGDRSKISSEDWYHPGDMVVSPDGETRTFREHQEMETQLTNPKSAYHDDFAEAGKRQRAREVLAPHPDMSGWKTAEEWEAHRQRERDEEIATMTALANKVGRAIPTYKDTRYALLLTEEFYSSGELKAHQGRFGDRVTLDTVSGRNHKQFITSVLGKAKGKESKTVVLVPDDLDEPSLKQLTAVGIRFVRTNATALMEARAKNDPDRAKFQTDTYVTMLLVRHITEDMSKNSAAYRLLGFYLKSHFDFKGIAIDDYIKAILNNEVPKLIQGYLAYRPIKLYSAKKDYEGIAKTLISA